MGGKALNRFGVYTERKNTAEFERIGSELSKQISRDLGLDTSIVKCYHSKQDHGDLDLLIKLDSWKNVNWREYIQNTFNPKAINANANVYSFDYDNFQVDFILIQSSKWDTAKVYYSYDPLGNVMGKTFHKFGLSYGWDGLFYKFRNFNGRNSNDIILTNDARTIFEFGGYDYDRYLQGFETLEEIFKFCISSKYFDTEIFQMENLKAIDKKRNRKRGSYHLFLNYIKDNGITTRYEFKKDKEEYLPEINAKFPEANIVEKLNKLKELDDMNKLVSEKFNGNLIMEIIPELSGKELGDVITRFKGSYGDSFKQFVLDNEPKIIMNKFVEFYESSK